MVYDQHYGREIFEGLKQILTPLFSWAGTKKILPNLSWIGLTTALSETPGPSGSASSISTTTTTTTFTNQESGRIPHLRIGTRTTPFPQRNQLSADRETLVEEHIIGVPGDDFIDNFLEREDLNEVRLAKEFIKFNERCFVRLLGDMRAYNSSWR